MNLLLIGHGTTDTRRLLIIGQEAGLTNRNTKLVLVIKANT